MTLQRRRAKHLVNEKENIDPREQKSNIPRRTSSLFLKRSQSLMEPDHQKPNFLSSSTPSFIAGEVSLVESQQVRILHKSEIGVSSDFSIITESLIALSR